MTSKLPGFGTNIFTVMTRLANETGAVNLSQGFPDFDGPQELRDAVNWHLDHGHNQYAPLQGVAELRQQIAVKVRDLYGATVDPDTQVVVTPGATEAIFCAVTALIHPGDEAIIIDPAYDTYDPCVRLNGGIPVHVPMTAGFSIDWNRVRDAVTPRTRLIMVNSPHNPTGSVWSETDIEALRSIVAQYGLYVVSDEVYEHICFTGMHHGLLRYPDLASRAFVVSSFGKTYHATGWRVGYCIAPSELTEEFLKIHQFINFSTNTPMQYAIADYMRDRPEFHQTLDRFYQKKRDRFCQLLSESKFKGVPADGTYFQLLHYGRVSDLPDTEFVRWLAVEHKVAAIPISVFYESPPPDQRVIRCCFAKGNDTLWQAAKALLKL
jgi:methionine aminotransferase